MFDTTKIKKVLAETFECAEDDWYRFKLEEVEHHSYDGFIPFTDGGFRVRKFITLDTFNSVDFNIPVIDNIIQGFIDSNREYAMKRFIQDHPEYEGTEFNYNSLYDEGNGKLAEELSNIEDSSNGDDTIMIEFAVYYYGKGNTHSPIRNGKESLNVFAVINYETPYHRHGMNNEYTVIDIDMRINPFTKLFITRRLRKQAKAIAKLFSRVDS